MLWRMSRFESVREVAQNPDILRLIFAQLDPMLQYNRVVREFHDPRYKAHFKRLFTASRNNDEIHPGRWLVHIIYPQVSGWPYWLTPKFKCEDINLYGCMIKTTRTNWTNNHFELEYNSRDCEGIRTLFYNRA
eukprot:COSAG02_NODE_331_length_24480_cov_22.114720_4_plen_133_part_00